MSLIGKKVSACSVLIPHLAGTEWGADQTTLRTSTLKSDSDVRDELVSGGGGVVSTVQT